MLMHNNTSHEDISVSLTYVDVVTAQVGVTVDVGLTSFFFISFNLLLKNERRTKLGLFLTNS